MTRLLFVLAAVWWRQCDLGQFVKGTMTPSPANHIYNVWYCRTSHTGWSGDVCVCVCVWGTQLWSPLEATTVSVVTCWDAADVIVLSMDKCQLLAIKAHLIRHGLILITSVYLVFCWISGKTWGRSRRLRCKRLSQVPTCISVVRVSRHIEKEEW